MWSASRGGDVMGVVLRADALSAGWQTAGAAGHSAWQALNLPLSGPLSAVPVSAVPPSGRLPGELPTSAFRAAVAAAFVALKAVLVPAAAGGRPQLCVLLAGPGMGLVTMPWSDALLQPEAAQRHARAELQSHGLEVQPEDPVCIDHRPALGHPRSVYWVPGWLQHEIDSLALAVAARRCSVQSLNLVAAAWLARQHHDAHALGLLGSGTLQLWPQRGATAASLVLADTPTAGALAERVPRLWQRAGLRSPALAMAPGLRLLSLDEPPPPDAAQGRAPQWAPWPATPEAGGRAALDRSLVAAAWARPVLPWRTAGELPALPPLGWAAAAGLAAATALAVLAMQHEATLRDTLRHGSVAPGSASPAAAATPAERAELGAVNAAVRQINLPLPALLRALQPPRDIPVLLLSLDLPSRAGDGEVQGGAAARRAAEGSVKLTALAPHSRDMTRYLSFLSGRPGVGAVHLLRHELDTAAPAAAYRFEVELQWPR
ncbi:MAG: hypothetical protein Q8K91_01715 [Hylemonella sp.]|nr:hypothetical protein [Hylemonella sp.]